ncbi:MAG: hypothetical protein CMM01_02520 [Rhodopirellula sp.]|nr:hypothetical protein [Rhodopirellula sp.]
MGSLRVFLAVFVRKTGRMKSAAVTVWDQGWLWFMKRVHQDMTAWADIPCGVAQFGAGYPKCFAHARSCVMSL